MNTHHHHTGADNHGHHTHSGAGTTAVDPVCGMQVDPDQTAYRAEHEGVTHHFCSARCLERFVVDPAQYLTRRPDDVSEQALAGTTYACPMHPQVRQEGPGICPICGMALEPEMPGLDDEDNPELRDFSRRFTGCAWSRHGLFMRPATKVTRGRALRARPATPAA